MCFWASYFCCLYSLWQTFLSTREGAWVIGRMSDNGLPLDMTAINRLNNVLMSLLPQSLTNWSAERAVNQKYDHKLYCLRPRHRWHTLTWMMIMSEGMNPSLWFIFKAPIHILWPRRLQYTAQSSVNDSFTVTRWSCFLNIGFSAWACPEFSPQRICNLLLPSCP